MNIQDPENELNSIISKWLGYVSVACWLVVLVPQYIENYKRKSGEGVSLVCVLFWVFGDIANIVGCVIQRLIPSITLVACYFLTIDTMMVSQILYYRITNEQSEYSESNSNDQCLESQHQQSSASSSTDRLISPGAPVTEDALLVPPIPDSAIQSSENNVGNSTVITTTTATTIASRTRKLGNWKYYTWLVGTITTVVVLIWTYYYALFRPLPSNEGKSILKPPKNDMESIAKLLGYISAFVYIWSYVFQAYQNWKAKSTEGLSIFLFIFTVGGNMTYCFSILVVSLDPEYLALYQPWLLGASIPTLVHCLIFYQFYLYSKEPTVATRIRDNEHHRSTGTSNNHAGGTLRSSQTRDAIA